MTTTDWSYYGPSQRCSAADGTSDAVACAERLDGLKDQDGAALRDLADGGDRCAFVAWMEVLVDAGRTDDLRALADAGDGRALATLMELHLHREREDDLRADVARFDAIDWLLHHLEQRGRAGEAVAELDAWLAERPERRGAWRGRRLDLLLAAGRVDEVRGAAAAGDRAATRRLAGLDDGTGTS